jgi:hypothetical protein
MGEAIPTLDLTLEEGAPVDPEVLIERDAEDTLVILAESSKGMVHVCALGPQANALGEPAAALLYMIVVTIPLLLVAFVGRALELNSYIVGVTALAAGVVGAVLTCHIARRPGLADRSRRLNEPAPTPHQT